MSILETSFSLFMTYIKTGETETKIEGEPFMLGGIMWKAVATLYRQAYINPNQTNRRRLYMWYNYRIGITCLLDENIKYFYCRGAAEHVRYWTSVNAVLPPNLLFDRPPKERIDKTVGGHMVDHMKHEYTQDSRTMYASVIIDPGLRDIGATEPHDRAMKIDVIFRLIDVLAPIYCDPAQLGNTPWNDLEVFCGESGSLRTSKSLLASCSPYFQALLYGNFKEKNVDYVRLPDINVIDLEVLLHHIYPNCRNYISQHNVETLLFMADRFLMSCVTEECEKFLLFHKGDKSHEQPVSMDEKIRFADTFRLHRLRQQCQNELNAKKDDIFGRRSTTTVDELSDIEVEAATTSSTSNNVSNGCI